MTVVPRWKTYGRPAGADGREEADERDDRLRVRGVSLEVEPDLGGRRGLERHQGYLSAGERFRRLAHEE